MKKSQFTESQIVAILKETDTGMKVSEVCRKYGIRITSRKFRKLVRGGSEKGVSLAV